MSFAAVNTVPCRALAPLIQRWLDEYIAAHPLVRGNQDTAHYVERDAQREHESDALNVLAFHAHTSTRTLRRILSGGFHDNGHWYDYVSFDLADKIVLASFGVTEWHLNPELAQYYGPLAVTRKERKAKYEMPALAEAM